jgi:hypothetical protein
MDCRGSLFRGVFSIWEPREPPCAARRKGELPRVVLGKDVSGLIPLHTRSSNLVPCARPRPSQLIASLPAAWVPETGGSTRLTGPLGWMGLGTGVALSAAASPGSILLRPLDGGDEGPGDDMTSRACHHKSHRPRIVPMIGAAGHDPREGGLP